MKPEEPAERRRVYIDCSQDDKLINIVCFMFCMRCWRLLDACICNFLDAFEIFTQVSETIRWVFARELQPSA